MQKRAPPLAVQISVINNYFFSSFPYAQLAVAHGEKVIEQPYVADRDPVSVQMPLSLVFFFFIEELTNGQAISAGVQGESGTVQQITLFGCLISDNYKVYYNKWKLLLHPFFWLLLQPQAAQLGILFDENN